MAHLLCEIGYVAVVEVEHFEIGLIEGFERFCEVGWKPDSYRPPLYALIVRLVNVEQSIPEC